MASASGAVLLLSLALLVSQLHVSYAPLPSGKGDPHFVGGHGTRYDFNGEPGKTYCLITDKDVHINSLLKGYKLDGESGMRSAKDGEHSIRTWMGELGLTWKDGSSANQHTLHLVSRHNTQDTSTPGLLASAFLDGASVAIPMTPGLVIDAAGLKLSFLGTKKMATHECELWVLSLGDTFAMEIDMEPAMPEYRLENDAMIHFSFRINKFKSSDSVHGILGQTFRNTPAQILKSLKYSTLGQLLMEPVRADGLTGLGFLDGSVEDYEASSALAPDCKFAQM